MMGDAPTPRRPVRLLALEGGGDGHRDLGVAGRGESEHPVVLEPFGSTVRAVPGLTAARRYDRKIPAAVAFGTKNKIRKKRKPAE